MALCNNELGKVFDYAAMNYDILGVIIEEVTNMSYEERVVIWRYMQSIVIIE